MVDNQQRLIRGHAAYTKTRRPTKSRSNTVPQKNRRHLPKHSCAVHRARKRARSLLGDVANNRDPLQERGKAAARTEDTFRKIAENYLAREGKTLRTANQRRQMLETKVFKHFGDWHINDIRRSDIVKLLDRIEDENGPVMADRTLATVRAA